MKKRLLGLGLAASLLCSPLAAEQTNTAGGGTDAALHSVATKFDVAGMKLGMTPKEIRAALLKGGFTPRPSDPDQDDWESRISREVAKRRNIKPSSGKVPLFTMASGPRGEHIEIWYYAGPSGAQAASITFSMSADHITKAQFRQAAVAKYGEPTTRGYGSNMLYCSGGEASCKPWDNQEKPYLSAGDAVAPLKIVLSFGQDARQLATSEFRTEVERRAPKDAPASF